MNPADIWQPLAAAAHSQSSADTGPVWYWLPGWGFKATVFEPLLSRLPGVHLGLDYPVFYQQLTRFNSTPVCSDATHLLQQSATADAIWVGWSLGGALAHAALSQPSAQQTKPAISARALCTMATGHHFLSQPTAPQQGMDAAAFTGFRNSLERFPAKTLKRFLALCCQGAEQARSNMTTLANAQLDSTQAALLATSLDWLTQYQLDDAQLDKQQPGMPRLACYSQQDALRPAGLTSSHGLLAEAGQSHALLVEETTIPSLQDALLQLLDHSVGTPQ
ncbi:hypothetical protein Q4551_11490 [Oceanobacter sp. 5_MG-2023]|uniref:hypothetical protein n=1 Tax=Oceanobacter sp. 5_MG-2023 TaxID=3062645 RepID=UPI0026E2411F|nr:hypothetical protein [Oceanobacter sp. 5_MG-2023]MDO6682913.1 hypothetical protein [Oceanobacter sp. 5_MG-2023]